VIPLTRLIGRRLSEAAGRSRQRLRDVVVDVTEPDGVATGLLLGRSAHARFVPWRDVRLHPRTGMPTQFVDGHPRAVVTGSELLLVRDVLDSRVYDVRARRTDRVAEVWLELREGRLEVAGVEVGARAMVRRLLPIEPSDRASTAPRMLLPLSAIHLMSPGGHRAQLSSAGSPVHRLSGAGTAHLLTHLPPDAAAELARRLPEQHRRRVVQRLHPRVGDRLRQALGSGSPARRPRTRRTDGWRLFLPPEDDHKGPR